MTEEQLKRLLDSQTKTIAGQLTEHLDKRLNSALADFFGKQTRYFDQRFDALRDELKGEIDQLRNTMDGIAKRLDDDAIEQEIVNHRHEGWIGQLAEHTDAKLRPELE